jgi:Flp pilus assembly protein TadD
LGWIRYRQGDLATAKVLIERAVRLVGDDATLFEHLGDVLAALGDREGALRSFDKSLAIGPENRAAVELKRKALASRNGS